MRIFVPGSIGNVGPGFDVLGLAVEGLGDIVEVELTGGPAEVRAITGRDAELVPLESDKNCAVVAAIALLERRGIDRRPIVTIERGLPISGGLGASAAASVGGAVAAAAAAGVEATRVEIMQAALCGESLVAGRHLDNIAPSLFGGLTIARSVDPPDVVEVPLGADWPLALVTPPLRINTRDARRVLPESLPQADWVKQSAQTAALVAAFASGSPELARRALVDPYAEPRRSALIPGFDAAKKAALDQGALGCSISGAGPTIFALCQDVATATKVAAAMATAFDPTAVTHVGPIARQGARPVASSV
ncbi:MAG: homoserine kinase [Myxococcota bacterium]